MHTALKLRNGTTLTVHAWSYANAASAMSNYLSLLQALRALQQDASMAQEAQALTDIVAADAGVQTEQLHASDLGPLLEVIHELNDVEDLLGKPLALLVRALTALQKAQEPEPEESEPNAPSGNATPPNSSPSSAPPPTRP
ncbi:hypothetical protein [Deinococcus aquiradiocola]|uniref:Uncharacterized protein n=1 Tax=Deinococcus aquiradiocola TaxID=393059 RepID=A0A917UKZ9_9DEIO|nr:hypothetical protein [Deinococcus aquiradiocola]GGJ65357.1 hypothetical protein GCM10008939_06600 [Deinococcus aquiradiocola]